MRFTRLIAALFVSILVDCVPIGYKPSALAVLPGVNGQLAYDRGGGPTGGGEGGDIWIAKADGSHKTQLTSGASVDADPAWAPDGKALVFEGGPLNGAHDIFVINSDGTGRTNLTNASGSYACPSWSPDGTQILFQSGPVAFAQIEIMNADGSGRTTIGAGICPAWSPDGTRIAFDDGSGLHTMDPDGTNVSDVTTGIVSKHATWSPDGAKLAFEGFTDGNYEAFVVNADGTGFTRVTTDSADDVAPTFSPDGTRLLTSKTVFAPDPLLGIASIDLADPTQITRLTATFDQHPDMLALQVSLSTSRMSVPYLHPVTVTAHLAPFTTSSNPVVSIYMAPFGGTKRLIAESAVDVAGDLSATATLKKNSTFVAEWAGDPQHVSMLSPQLTVGVHVKTTGHLQGSYSHRGQYRLYHVGDPARFVADVVPNHRGDLLYFEVQRHRSGHWRTIDRAHFHIERNGTVTVFVVLPRGDYRIQAEFRGDADHLGDLSPWAYLRVTS